MQQLLPAAAAAAAAVAVVAQQIGEIMTYVAHREPTIHSNSTPHLNDAPAAHTVIGSKP